MKKISFIPLIMKRFLYLSAILFFINITSCKKKDHRQYSYWSVNKNDFKTNHVNVDIGKAASVLGNNQDDPENCFSIRFSIGYQLPTGGVFHINDTSIHYNISDYAVIDFRYNNEYYFMAYPTDHYLSATSVNGKAQYTLPPTWFYSYYHPEDSVLIQGTFNEP